MYIFINIIIILILVLVNIDLVLKFHPFFPCLDYIETGLITPIVKDANLKGLKTISNSVKEMASRAKENKLAPHEYQVLFFFET